RRPASSRSARVAPVWSPTRSVTSAMSPAGSASPPPQAPAARRRGTAAAAAAARWCTVMEGLLISSGEASRLHGPPNRSHIARLRSRNIVIPTKQVKIVDLWRTARRRGPRGAPALRGSETGEHDHRHLRTDGRPLPHRDPVGGSRDRDPAVLRKGAVPHPHPGRAPPRP